MRAAGLLQLTRREVDVLLLVARGCLNTEIAGRLGMASGTVRNHLYNTYQKLDVHDRTAAAVIACAVARDLDRRRHAQE